MSLTNSAPKLMSIPPSHLQGILRIVPKFKPKMKVYGFPLTLSVSIFLFTVS
jgi:hypothetical protein